MVGRSRGFISFVSYVVAGGPAPTDAEQTSSAGVLTFVSAPSPRLQSYPRRIIDGIAAASRFDR